MSDTHHFKADLVLLAVTLIAAMGWIFSKEALAGLPPLLFIGIRFLLAGAVLGVIGRHLLRRLSATELRRSLIVGAVMSVAMIFWILGLHHATHLGEGAFITSLGVILVPVLARWVFGDRPPTSIWIALPVAVTGLAFLSLNKGFNLEAGQLYFLLAACSFAVQFNLVTRLVAQVPASALTALQLMVVGVVVLSVSALTETWPSQVAPSIWGWLAASALIATSLRFFLQTYGQSLTPASHAAVIMNLEPVWTALLAALWFGEVMSGLQAMGCGLIFGAMLISRWPWVRQMLRSLRPAAAPSREP